MGTNADQFFEGAEKLLEIWFSSRNSGTDVKSLRIISEWQWSKLLEYAHCQICSHTSNDFMDAYVLSESSMFIFDDRFILKTCGTTSLIHTVKPLMALVETVCGFDKVVNLFYTRKNFLRPELQPEPHANFEDEAAYLDELFDGGGAAYCLGRLNQDRWYLYALNEVDPEDCSIKFPDQTLEVLMSELDPEVTSIFSTSVCSNGKEATKLSGIDKLVPFGMTIDDKLFEPHGYSMNGILSDSDEYCTIHITPEEAFSYASFETNVRQIGFMDQAWRVVKCFRPGKFLLTLFVNKASREVLEGQKMVWERSIPGYKRVDTHFVMLPEHVVTYCYFVRVD